MGQWVDPDGVFLGGAVVTIEADGTGAANVGSEVRLAGRSISP